MKARPLKKRRDADYFIYHEGRHPYVYKIAGNQAFWIGKNQLVWHKGASSDMRLVLATWQKTPFTKIKMLFPDIIS